MLLRLKFSVVRQVISRLALSPSTSTAYSVCVSHLTTASPACLQPKPPLSRNLNYLSTKPWSIALHSDVSVAALILSSVYNGLDVRTKYVPLPHWTLCPTIDGHRQQPILATQNKVHPKGTALFLQINKKRMPIQLPQIVIWFQSTTNLLPFFLLRCLYYKQ